MKVPDDAVTVWEVGGSVRDELLGLTSKDKDFAVELHQPGLDIETGFAIMVDYLVERGYTIFVETPQYLTVRAHFPSDHPMFGKTTADFVLCREDGAYSDGRRPDEVRVGTILQDLSRRDFSVNAMARRLGSDEIIDPFDGQHDLEDRRLYAVGNARDRLTEDPLRALRALRFMVCKNFILSEGLRATIYADWFAPLLASVSAERKREELTKMFKYNTPLSFLQFSGAGAKPLRDAVFTDGLWLRPTLEER